MRRPRSEASKRLTSQEWRRLLGRKVSIRFRRHGDDEHPFSEAIGVVRAADEHEVAILTRRGTETTVALADVVATKVFPP
jgi:ribosome maturation factor RimP